MLPALIIPIIMDIATEQALAQIARSGAVTAITYSTEIGVYSIKAYNWIFSRNTYFYTMKIGKNIKGFGVTRNLTSRVATHKRNCLRAGTSCELIEAKLYTKEKAYRIERELKRSKDIIDTGIPGFRTEAIPMNPWYSDILYTIKRIIK